MLLPKPENDFTPPPAGNHPARCYRVIDLGTQSTNYMGKPKIQHKIMIGWELFCDEKLDDGRNFTVNNRYTFSGYERSTLRQHLEAWRGRAFTDMDWDTFHIESIIGKACLLQIKHDPKDGGGVYANIASIGSIPKGLEVPALTNETVFFSLDPKEFKREAFDKLSDNLKITIQKSPEWAELNSPGPQQEHIAEAHDDLDSSIP